MEALGTKERTDEVLRPFILAVNEAEADSLLAEILSQHAHPIIRNIIKAKLGVSFNQQDGSHENQDALEIGSEITGTLLGELRSLKRLPGQKTINNFQNYVAVVTFNACYNYLRRKYPRRHSLKNRLRYLLTHRNDFALWESPDGDWMCGAAVWRGQKRRAESDRQLQSLTQDSAGFVRSKLPGRNLAQL